MNSSPEIASTAVSVIALVRALIEGAEVHEPGTPVRVGVSGSQHFGSGGFSGGSKRWGPVEEVPGSNESENTRFISQTYMMVFGKDGAVWLYRTSDCIGETGRHSEYWYAWSGEPLAQRADVRAALAGWRRDVAVKARLRSAVRAKEEAERRHRALHIRDGAWTCGTFYCGMAPPELSELLGPGDRAYLLWRSLTDSERRWFTTADAEKTLRNAVEQDVAGLAGARRDADAFEGGCRDLLRKAEEARRDAEFWRGKHQPRHESESLEAAQGLEERAQRSWDAAGHERSAENLYRESLARARDELNRYLCSKATGLFE